MRVILITAPADPGDEDPAVHQINLHSGGPARTGLGVDLLLLDARGMTPGVLAIALNEVSRIRTTIGLRHSILIRAELDLKLAVTAMRAGFNDILDRPLGSLQLVRLIRQLGSRHGPGLQTLLRYTRIMPPPRVVGAANVFLAIQKKEQDNLLKLEQIEVREKRLEEQTEALLARETEVKSTARRLEQDFAKMQMDVDLDRPEPTPVSPASDIAAREDWLGRFEQELAQRARELDARTAALELRESLCRDLEALVQAQSG